MDFDYRLLAKYLTGMLSPEEMKQVEEWRELSIDNEEVFSELMKLRVSWKFTQYNTPEHIEKALNGLNAKITRGRCEKNRACGWIGCLVKGGVFFEDT